MCDSDNNGYHDHYTGNANVHADRSSLSEQYSTSASWNIRQWLCRSMGTSHDQYSSNRNDYLYIYTNRSMCYGDNDGYYDHYTGNTNVHADRSSLSEQYSTSTSWHIRQWLCRSMESSNN